MVARGLSFLIRGSNVVSLEYRVSGKDNQFLKRIFVLLFCSFLLLSCSEDKKPYAPIRVSLDAENYTDNFDKITEYQKPRPKITIIPPSWLSFNVLRKMSSMPESISVKIGQELPEFTLVFHGKWTRKPKTTYEYYYLSHIEVMDSSSSKIIQTIAHKNEFNGAIYLPDLNQDGYLDLMVQSDYGATGIYTCQVHIFQPKLMRFKRHALLSKMNSVSLDEDSKLIAAYNRWGGYGEFREYFKMEKGGALMLEKVEWTEWDPRNSETGFFKFIAVPRGDRNITYLGRRFNPEDKKFTKLLHQKVKVVKKEEFYLRLDRKYKYE